mmetsp:Transcript_653/g.1145  ORF Transcript_653/g.1145 Transcript_653/m.1145 type:complete len:140 (-) Transcript_653:124-543(-)
MRLDVLHRTERLRFLPFGLHLWHRCCLTKPVAHLLRDFYMIDLAFRSSGFYRQRDQRRSHLLSSFISTKGQTVQKDSAHSICSILPLDPRNSTQIGSDTRRYQPIEDRMQKYKVDDSSEEQHHWSTSTPNKFPHQPTRH